MRHLPERFSGSLPAPAIVSSVAADLQRPICFSTLGWCSGSVKLTLRCKGFFTGTGLLLSLPRIPRGSPTRGQNQKRGTVFKGTSDSEKWV